MLIYTPSGCRIQTTSDILRGSDSANVQRLNSQRFEGCPSTRSSLIYYIDNVLQAGECGTGLMLGITGINTPGPYA